MPLASAVVFMSAEVARVYDLFTMILPVISVNRTVFISLVSIVTRSFAGFGIILKPVLFANIGTAVPFSPQLLASGFNSMGSPATSVWPANPE